MTRPRRLALGGLVAAVLACGGVALAQVVAAPVAVEQGPRWSSLTPTQQATLAPLQRDWATIDTARKQKWLEVAAKYQGYSAEERQRAQVRMAEWVRMTPAERGRARLQFQESRQLPAQDRRARWEAYQALPEDQRKALAERGARTQGGAPRDAAAAQAKAPPARPSAGAPPATVKQNVIVPPTAAATAPKPVAPTIVQAKPGATTTLVTKTPSPPPHHQPGLPKIAATKGFVDQTTLLPKRGPQGAAVAAAPAPSSASDAQP